jgi:hypothetical protein
MDSHSRRQYRQGDLLLEPVSADPKARPHRLVPREAGRILLTHEEATGHAHVVEESSAELVELESGERFLIADCGASLRHEEHAPVELPPGTYRVTRA